MSSASWILSEDAEAVSVAEAAHDAPFEPGRVRGVTIPFRREKGDIANAEGEELIIAHAEQVLGTRCADGMGNMGELRWNPFFGSLLYKLRHQNIKPVVRYQARVYVVQALARWEPRLRVTDVEVIEEPRRLRIRSSVRIIGVGSSSEDRTIETAIER